MKIQLSWLDGVAFSLQTESGHQLLADGAPEHGGQNRGARPMELVLAGAAACAAFDVVHILKKSRREPISLTAEVEAERREDEPRVFTRIHLRFRLQGKNLSAAPVERAIALSVEKYCSALAMLSSTAEVSHSCEIDA